MLAFGHFTALMEKVHAGYGLFVDEEFGQMLFGENTPSFVIEKVGYELTILNWNELHSDIKNEMPPSYRIYAARRKEGASLKLRVWELTKQQKELANQWNWGDKLYFRETTRVAEEDSRTMEIDIINNHSIGITVDGRNYEPYLNDKETVLRFARETYSRSLLNKEGRSSGHERMY